MFENLASQGKNFEKGGRHELNYHVKVQGRVQEFSKGGGGGVPFYFISGVLRELERPYQTKEFLGKVGEKAVRL